MHIPEAVPSPIPIPFCVSHHLLSMPLTLLFPNLCPFLKCCHGLQLHQGPSRWLVPSNSATDPRSELRTGQWPVGQCDINYLIFVRSQVTEHRIEKIKLKSQFCVQSAKWFGGSHWVPWKAYSFLVLLTRTPDQYFWFIPTRSGWCWDWT